MTSGYYFRRNGQRFGPFFKKNKGVKGLLVYVKSIGIRVYAVPTHAPKRKYLRRTEFQHEFNINQQRGVGMRRIDLSGIPASRKNDPGTSKSAEMAIDISGVRSSQASRCLEVLQEMNGPLTSAEVAALAGFEDRNIASRRLPELEKKGLAARVNGGRRKCTVKGTMQNTWIEKDGSNEKDS